MRTTYPDKPAKDYNEWMQYIYKQLGYPKQPTKKIQEPKNLYEWLAYIKQERNRPCR